MKNYIQEGKIISFTAGGTLTSGQGYLHGSLFGVICNDAVSGETAELAVSGVFELAKAAVSWSAGDKLYWDAGNSVITNVASTHHFIGVATEAVSSGTATGKFLLLQTGSDDYNTVGEIVTGLEALTGGDKLSADAIKDGTTNHVFTATDDSKLAAIEASADVTDATNVAAAGAVMDADFTPDEGLLRKTAAGTYTAHKTNLAAAVAPTVNDDNTGGYSVGSIWLDTTADLGYVCIDSTTGAAVWLLWMTAAQSSKLAAIEASADVTDATNVAAAGAQMRTTNTNVDKEFIASYTCIGDDDTAGYKDIDTGFGSAPEFFTVQILRAGVDVKADAIVTALGGGDAGKIRIADGSATYACTAGDVIMLRACNVI